MTGRNIDANRGKDIFAYELVQVLEEGWKEMVLRKRNKDSEMIGKTNIMQYKR